MYIEDLSCNLDKLPFILVKDGSIIKASGQFIDMTEFRQDELLNINIEEVLRILRAGPSIEFNNIVEQADYFLFTKSLDVKFVNIRVINEEKEKAYIFLEKPLSDFRTKFPFVNTLFSDNYYGIGIYSAPDMTLLKANEKYLGFFDEPFNEEKNCIGKHISEFITGFIGSSYEDIWNKVLKTGKSYNLEEYMYEGLKRGITYWKLSLVPILEDNKIKYCVVMTIDITEQVLHRKKINEQARTIEQHKKELEAVLDNMIDGFAVIDKNGSFIHINETIRKWMQYVDPKKVKDALGQVKCYDLNGRELKQNELPVIMVLSGKKIEKYEFVMKINGTERYISASGTPIYDEKGNFIMGVLNARDISDRIRERRLIRQQKECLEAIINSMSDGLELVDDKLKITFLNQSARKFFYNPDVKINAGDSLKYNKYYYGIDGEEIPSEDLPAFRVIKKGSFQNYRLTIERPDKKIYASINGSPIFDDNGKVKSAILSIRDITQQVMLDAAIEYHQQSVLEAEHERNETLKKALEMKDEFLSLISHEFKTPLNVISTAIQAMNYICGDELSDKSKKYLGMIRQNTFRQLRLVNNLLDITRANAGRIKINKNNIDIVFLTRSITESVQVYASQKGVNVTFISTLKKKVVAFDDEKYERILLNLLSNAIKFTPEGKAIKVSLSTARGGICVKVKDDGIGIPPNKIDIIFERFGQVDSSLSRQAEGTGIGLSLVKKFVEALGGSISVKSKVGLGSTFTLLLPDETAAEERKEKEMADLLDNRLIQTANVEFSDIYL